jgi:tight adherence protein C
MLLILGALFLGLAAFVAAEARTLPARQRRDLVRRAATYGALPTASGAGGRRTASGGPVLAPLVAWLATCLLRLMPRTTRSTVTERLLRAGLANRISADEFVAAKGLLALVGAGLGVAIGVAVGVAAGFFLALSFGLVGLVGLDLFVNSRFSRRRESIRAALPDALDLLAVTVEAGLGFDGALVKLTDFMEGPLAEEFALTLNEMRIGESRIDALKRMATRVDVRELSSFVRAVVQADQLGMSMGAMLRVQAADVRVRRQLAAEEQAMKMPIKMIFPMVLFLLPAMFIVILGPFFLSGFGENM